MSEQVQNQGYQIREVEAEHVAADAVCAAAEVRVQSFLCQNLLCGAKSVNYLDAEGSLETRSLECLKGATVRWKNFFSSVIMYKCVSIRRLHNIWSLDPH